MGSIITSTGTVLYSLLYSNSHQGFNGQKYMYSVISVIVDLLPGNIKNRQSTRSWTARVQLFHPWAVRSSPVLFLQVPKLCTDLDLCLFYILTLGTYSKFARKNNPSSRRLLSAALLVRWPQVCRLKITFTKARTNCFVSTTKSSMKCVVNCIQYPTQRCSFLKCFGNVFREHWETGAVSICFCSYFLFP